LQVVNAWNYGDVYVLEDLKGWQLSRCVFVADAGMVSNANLEALARAGGKYIVAMPVHRGGEVAVEVLTRRGHRQQVAENLAVGEVTVGDGGMAAALRRLP
jgi:hypothetical protein